MLMLNRLKSVARTQHGDTIIEVLVCTAVISFVMLGAYLSIRRDYVSLEETQERRRAVKLVETQVEALHTQSNIGNPPITLPGGCFYQNAGGLSTSANSGVAPNPCILDSSGNQATASTQLQYSLSINWVPTTVSTSSGAPLTIETYTVTATWQGYSGQDTVSMEYRTQ